VLTECLRRVRQYGELDEDRFADCVRDLPALLRDWADQLDAPPPNVVGRPEVPGFEGYSMWAESYDQKEDNRVIAGEEDVIWDLIGEVRGLRVLDVGCGTGRHALPLAAQGAEVVGVEPAQGMLDRAREKARAQGLYLDLRAGSVHALPSDLAQYDLVLCCLVLSHVADLDGAVSALAARLRPGGRLIVSDFHPFDLLLGFRTSFGEGADHYLVPNYVHLPSDYLSAMSSAGLSVTRFYERGAFRGLPGLPATIVMEGTRSEN
jgi:ubiquinone/menaquinone biosynthesis C-methylase UbiE